MHRLPAAGPGRLVADGLEPPADLAHDIGEPLPVLFGAFQPTQGLRAAGTKLRDPGSFLEDSAAVAARRHQQGVDPPLFNHAVGLGCGPRARKELANVAKPRGLTVDEVLALPIAVDPPRDLDVLGRHRELPGRVVENQRNLGHVERLAARRAGEDDVGHLLAPKAADRLLAEHPLDRVDDV